MIEQSAPPSGAPTLRAGRQPQTPSTPPPVLPLAVAALVLAAGAAAVCTLALLGLGRMLGHGISPVTTTLLVILAAASWVPVLPALRALAMARERHRHLQVGALPDARHAASVGQEHARVGLGYALFALVLAGAVAFVTANGGAVAHTFLRTDLITASWGDVARAFWVNIRVAVGAEVLVLVVGLVVAVMRMLPGRAGRPLRLLAIAYVDTFRAIPGIIVLYLVGFGLSLAKVPVIDGLAPIWLAILALTLTYGAYVAEVYRAGLESIHPSQWAAARSLGLSYSQALRRVIVPQAVRRIVPPLLNDFIGLQKDTALIGVMGVVDAFMQARLTSSAVFNLSPVTVVAVAFVVITIPQARFVDRLIARDHNRQRAGSK